MEKVLIKKESLIGRRIGAFIVDHVTITIIVMIPVIMNFNRLSKDFNFFYELFPVIMLMGVICYICKDVFWGRSVGKLLFGIFVREYETTDRTPRFYNLIFRNILIFIWFVEFIIMLIDKDGRRLGDKIAKTYFNGEDIIVALDSSKDKIGRKYKNKIRYSTYSKENLMNYLEALGF
jgi:uncharacterized RDD family membrane protein YckC